MRKLLLKTMLLLCALIVGSGTSWAETVTLTSAQIKAGSGSTSYGSCSATDGGGNTWNAYAIKNQHSNATSDYNYWQIKKYASNTAYYVQVPTLGTKITQLVITVSSSSKARDGGGNSATLYFSSSNSTSATGTGVASGTGANSVTIDCSSLDLNTGYITASAGVRIWDVEVTYTTGGGSTTYSVTYDDNGSTSGSVPTDNTAYSSGATVTVLGNTGSLAKTGYSFGGWNTQNDGQGTNYTAGNTFTISANTTLYAKWTANTHNVTMPAADTYGTYTMDASNPVAYGTTVELTYIPASGYENYEATWSVNNTPITGNSFSMPDENVTITVAVAEVQDYATLPFNWEGGILSAFSALTGISYSLNDDGSYAESHVPYRIKLTKTGDYLQIKTDSQPGKVTIGVKMIGGANASSITVQESANGSDFTNVETLSISGDQNSTHTLETSNAFASTSRYVRLYFNKGSNVGVGPITIEKASTDPVINAVSSVEMTAEETSGEIAYTISNPVGGTNLTASEEADWISNVTVQSDKVTFTTSVNTGASRTATITLTYGSASKEVTVTQAEHVVINTYTIAATITSGKHYIITNGSDKAMGAQSNNGNNRTAVGITINDGVASAASNSGVKEFVIYGPDANGRYSIYDETVPGYLYAASSSKNHLKTQNINDDNGLWIITFDTNTASIVADKSENHNVMRFNSSDGLFSCYESATQNPVCLYEKDGENAPTESKTLNGYGYATYCSKNALDFSDDSEVTAWIISAANSSTGVITFTQITGKAAAGTGMFLKGEESASVTLTSASGKDDLTDNLLIGTTKDFTVLGNDDYYGLSGNAFVKVNAGTVPAGKALLPVNRLTTSGNEVRAFTFVFVNPTTGISETQTVSAEQFGEIFNLAGQRMSKPQKGVNIINGKKVLVK